MLRTGDYDYVIVSAGSAGCVLAAHLSGDPGLGLAHGAGDASIWTTRAASWVAEEAGVSEQVQHDDSNDGGMTWH
jgi:hypothetical protein